MNGSTQSRSYAWILLALALVVLPTIVAAQSDRPEGPVATAVNALRDSIPADGTVKLDLTAVEARLQAAEVLSKTGYAAGSLTTSRRCSSDSPRSCRLDDSDAIVSVTEFDSTSPQTATVSVRIDWRSESERQPVYSATYQVDVALVDGAWTAVAVRLGRVT